MREYLKGILIERDIINKTEIETADYLSKLESIPTCRSYLQIKQKLKTYRNWNDYTTNGKKLKNESFQCKDLIKFTQRNTTTVQLPFLYYGHYVLDWLREWPKETRNAVFIEALIINEGTSTEIILIIKLKFLILR